MLLDTIGRAALFALDPETAHGVSIQALKCGLPLSFGAVRDDRLKVKLCGLEFPNPLGMAPGYDKNAEVPDALLGLGFGFAEVGTITPLAQPGNPKPRIFRLVEDRAVINRLGFNNEGHQAAEQRLKARAGKPGIVGVNIGANKDSADRIADYEAGVKRFARLASYLTVNISSPNTPGLRDMQARGALAELLARVMAARNQHGSGNLPVFLKIAPDLAEGDLEDVAAEILTNKVEGVIVSNTTLSRAGLRAANAREAGGMSGKPLFAKSTAVLARMRKLLGPDVAVIGVGGVDSAEAALEKIKAGADLVQLYTGMIYDGPGMPARVVRGLRDALQRDGVKSICDYRSQRLEHWLGQPV